MRNIFILPGIMGLFFLLSCHKGQNDVVAVPDIDPVVTEKGIETGELRTYTMGTGGGTIVSHDGSISLVIPPGAVSESITIGIQPVTNNAPLGLGNTFRLTPEGTHFSKPISLSFHYSNIPLGGVIQDFLWIVTQNENGTWSADTNSEVDTIAKTVTVTTTHFSDWALGRFMDLKLAPPTALVKTGQQVGLQVAGFLKPDAPDQDVLHPLAPIGSELVPLSALEALLDKTKKYQDFKLTNWSLNGTKAPVSNGNGKLEIAENVAIYTAPDKKPTPSTVAIAAELEAYQSAGRKTKYLLVSNITVVDSDYFMRLAVDGQDYNYTQYLGPDLPPDPGNYDYVGATMDEDDGHLIIRAGAFRNGDAITDGMLDIAFDHPAVVTRKYNCFWNNTGGNDRFSFLPHQQSPFYLEDYWVRRPGDFDCYMEQQCADISFSLTQFSGQGKETAGSFSGTIYEDPPGYKNSCQTSKQHKVSGEFKLFVH